MPSLVEIGPVVLEEKIFKYFQYNFTCSLLFPLGKGRGPSFQQTWIPFTQGCFVPSLVDIGPVVLEKKLKIGKVYRQTDGQTDGQTDDGRQVIRKTHLSFQLRWANKNQKPWTQSLHTLILPPVIIVYLSFYSNRNYNQRNDGH